MYTINTEIHFSQYERRDGNKMLNLEELKQLIAFSEMGTLSKVAETYHISTPSVTRSMRHIEEYFGVSLFSRSKNRIELNETGQAAVSYGKKLLEEAEQMTRQVRLVDEKQKTVTIKSCAPAPLWELLKEMNKIHRGKKISSQICKNEEVMRYIEKDECDLAILPFEREMPHWKKKLWMKEQLYVCVTAQHVLADRKKLYFSELNGFNFLLRSELGFWDSLCREKMPASKFLVQTEDAVFDELVRESSLPCFTTDYILEVENPYPERVIIPIEDEEAKITFYLMGKAPVIDNFS